MELPVELWMKVFEHLQLDDSSARPCHMHHYLNTTPSASESADVAEEQGVAGLPNDEKELWKTTRSYYGISRTSRAAA
jgi:hypothetical protein